MKNVSDYPEYAGEPNNIQFLGVAEHRFGAHDEDYHNTTNGRFDPLTGEMHEFEGAELPPLYIIDLTDKVDPSQSEFLDSLGRDFGYGRREDNIRSRERHKGEKSGYRFGG